MSTLKNSVKLIGNVGQTPEIRELESGKKMAKFSVATNESYYNKQGEKVTQTYWHNLIAWGKTAEVVENYVQKGNQIAIEGKLTNRTYEGQDGQKHYVTEVLVNEIVLLGAKAKS